MGDYAGQIAQCDFPKLVADIRDHLGSVPQASRDALEQYDPGAEERLEALLDRVLVVTATAVPETVPVDRPDVLRSALTDVNNGLAYLDDPVNMPQYAGQLINATNSLSSQLWTWPGSAAGDDWKDAVTGAATTYRRSLGQQLSSFNSELDELAGRVADAVAELDRLQEAKQQFEASMSDDLAALRDRNTERLATLEAQIESLNAQVTAAIARQDSAIQQYQEQFSTAQEKRSTDFAEFVHKSRQSASEAQAELDKAGKQSIQELRAQIDKAKEMVSVFAGAGTANAFGKEAQEQGEAANKWRLIAVALAIAGAVASAVLILEFRSKSSSIAEVVGKLAIAIVIAGAAGYAATQSAAHRKREVSNRRAELLLVSFEPFVRDLPEEEQDKARVALLQTLMTDTAHMPSSDGKDEPVISAGQMNLLKQLFDMIRR